MTRKSIIINYKHIRKPYLTLEQRYRNKRKLKKLLQRWTIAGKITIIIAIALFGYWLMNRPTLIAGAVETQHSTIRLEKMERREIVVEKVINDTPKKKTILREAKKDYKGNCFDYVNEMASKYKVDGEVMRKIIMAESGGNPNAKNKNSTAKSCSQFIDGTFIGWGKRLWGNEVYNIDRYDGKASVELMAYVISKGGLHNWDASKSKWSK